LAEAVHEGRQPRLSARYCLHVNELVLAIHHAPPEGGTFAMTTTAGTVEPMPWATRPSPWHRATADRLGRLPARLGRAGPDRG
jgi:hypothetical protein